MKRVAITARESWKQKAESQGFFFHSLGGNYWCEEAYYEFSHQESQLLASASETLHSLCLQAVEHVIKTRRFAELKIPEPFWDFITASYSNGEPTLYGRFDLSYAPGGVPKMLEYNADTPTSLVEGGIMQRSWKEDTYPAQGQMSYLRELLIERWRKVLPSGSLIHIASMEGEIEDRHNVNFLIDTAIAAGFPTKFLHMEEIAWSDEAGTFLDQDQLQISHLFKLYPWEWMVIDEFALKILDSSTQFIEPPWKMILSNKAILPVLWELFPGHENLLPTYFDSAPLGDTYVKKPIFSREGQNISIVENGTSSETAGLYGEEGHIYQQYAPLPDFSGSHPVIGAWIVGDRFGGIGIRESEGMVTGNMSRFVPHVVGA